MSINSPGFTVPHIAVVSHVAGLERDAVAWTEAVRLQMRDHVAPAWGAFAPVPGVFFYGAGDGLPADAVAVIGIFEDAGVAEAAGYHSALGKIAMGAVDLSRSDSPSRTLSHEALELYRNAYLDAWAPGPDSTPAHLDYAVELCDPVEAISYHVDVSVLGEERSIEVSDFILPAWWDSNPNIDAARDFCSCVRHPFEIAPGGYQIATDIDDNVIYLPARGEGVHAAKVARPLSRTLQITQGIRIPRPPHAEGAKP
jgi:hypothetical protein